MESADCVDLSGTAPGDEIRISVLSLTLDVAGPPFAKTLAAYEHPALKPLLVDVRESERMLIVKHPSGKHIQIAVTAFAYSAAIDPAEGRLTLVICEGWIQVRGELPRFKVALAKEYVGKEANTWPALAADCLRYGCRVAVTDQYAAGASETIAQQSGLRLHRKPWTASNKLESFTNLATLIHGDRVELPPNRQFRRDLLGVKKRTTQQGYTIVLPRDGRHCDFAPALAAAVGFASARLGIGNRNPVEQLLSARSQWDIAIGFLPRAMMACGQKINAAW